MPLVFPDLLVRDTLKAGFEATQRDPSIARDDIFLRMSEGQRDEAAKWFEEHQVPVKLGWPREVTELPGVFVLLQEAGESRPQVGGHFPDPDMRITETGTVMNATIRAMCLVNNNADLAVWIASVAYWALLASRQDLETNGRLLEQRLSISDLRPAVEWMPDFAFGRDVSLTAVVPASFLTAYALVNGILVRTHTTGSDEIHEVLIRR
jgi:hypothetical protein